MASSAPHGLLFSCDLKSGLPNWVWKCRYPVWPVAGRTLAFIVANVLPAAVPISPRARFRSSSTATLGR